MIFNGGLADLRALNLKFNEGLAGVHAVKLEVQ